jgi:hypothetical protein
MVWVRREDRQLKEHDLYLGLRSSFDVLDLLDAWDDRAYAMNISMATESRIDKVQAVVSI